MLFNSSNTMKIPFCSQNNINGQHSEELQKELASLNLDRTRGFIYLTVLLEFFLFIVEGYLMGNGSGSRVFENTFIYIYLILLIPSLCYLIFIAHLERLIRAGRIKGMTVNLLIGLYLTLAVAWGAYVCQVNQISNGALSSFVIVLMLGSLLLYLDSRVLAVPYTAALLIFIFAPGSQHFAEIGFKHYLNLGLFMILAWSISRTLYSSYSSEYAGRCLIEIQNRLLKEGNEELLKEVIARKQVQDRLELANRELVTLSLIDELTGIPNRRNLDFFINHEWNRGRREGTPIAFIMIDIDSFKAFNDYYGHVQGDWALNSVARALESSRRRSTDFVARYGGEEFLFVALNIDRDGAYTLAEMLRNTIESLSIPHAVSQCSSHLTISLGAVSIIPGEVDTIHQAVNMADIALYSAKKAGGNQVRTYQSPQVTLF